MRDDLKHIKKSARCINCDYSIPGIYDINDTRKSPHCNNPSRMSGDKLHLILNWFDMVCPEYKGDHLK